MTTTSAVYPLSEGMKTMTTLIGADSANKLAGLQIDLLRKLRQGKISLGTFEKFLRGELVEKNGSLTSALRKRPKPGTLSWEEATAYLYELAGLFAEFAEVRFLSRSLTPGQWEVVMLKDLTYATMAKLHKKARVRLETYGNDLQQVIDPEKEQRDANRDGSYVVAFKANVEADEENRNQSANDREAKNCQDITALERLFLGLVHFLATGKYLDEQNWTLCTGSRHRDGGVPGVGWDSDDRRVSVDCYDSDSSRDYLRSRSVVSSPSKQTKSV